MTKQDGYAGASAFLFVAVGYWLNGPFGAVAAWWIGVVVFAIAHSWDRDKRDVGTWLPIFAGVIIGGVATVATVERQSSAPNSASGPDRNASQSFEVRASAPPLAPTPAPTQAPLPKPEQRRPAPVPVPVPVPVPSPPAPQAVPSPVTVEWGIGNDDMQPLSVTNVTSAFLDDGVPLFLTDLLRLENGAFVETMMFHHYRGAYFKVLPRALALFTHEFGGMKPNFPISVPFFDRTKGLIPSSTPTHRIMVMDGKSSMPVPALSVDEPGTWRATIDYRVGQKRWTHYLCFVIPKPSAPPVPLATCPAERIRP